MRHLIVGDGVAGHTAAETLAEDQPDADIHVFTDEDVPFYDRIGLRDYIRGGRDEDDLVFDGSADLDESDRSRGSGGSASEDWYAERGIDLHLDTPIVDIDRETKTVTTDDGEDFRYDQLLLATGGRPRQLPMEDGVDHVHHLWTLEGHGTALRRDLERADEGVVIGGGLLGFDLIGAFNEVVNATYLVREDRWWHSVLTADGACIVHDAMREHGVTLRLNEEAEAMTNTDAGQVRITTGSGTYKGGVAGVAVGNVRNTDLAAGAGLETGKGIICDEHLRTGDDAIYAAGDVAAYHDPVLGKRNLGGSWITAEEQGKVAGRNMAGKEEELRLVDTYTVNHFGLNIASLGDPTATDGNTVVTAVNEDEQVYRKTVLDGDRIVGAAIIGEMAWMHPMKQLILEQVDVSGAVGELEDPAFNPGTLL